MIFWAILRAENAVWYNLAGAKPKDSIYYTLMGEHADNKARDSKQIVGMAFDSQEAFIKARYGG